MTDAAKRVALRYAAAIRWKRNVAEGKHTRATISKGRGQSWYVEVTTNWGARGPGKEKFLDSEGTIYKSEAIEAGEELMARWDRDIERMGREQFE